MVITFLTALHFLLCSPAVMAAPASEQFEIAKKSLVSVVTEYLLQHEELSNGGVATGLKFTHVNYKVAWTNIETNGDSIGIYALMGVLQ